MTKNMGLRAKIATTAVAAVMSGGLAIPATASAAPEAPTKAVTAMSAAKTQAAINGIDQRKRCFGYKVRRCLWINIDHSRNRVRFYGKASEGRTGTYYDVAINRLAAVMQEGQSTCPDGCPPLRPRIVHGDYDGYHARSDGAWSRLYGCTNGEWVSFAIEANFAWRNSSTGNTDSQRERLQGGFVC